MGGADQHHNVGQNAPAGNVIDGGTGNRDCSQAAAQHSALGQDSRQHRKGRDAHGRAHEQGEVGERYAVIGKPRIQIERQERGQHKRCGNADVTGQHGSVTFFLQLHGVDLQPNEEHEDDHADLAQRVQETQA